MQFDVKTWLVYGVGVLTIPFLFVLLELIIRFIRFFRRWFINLPITQWFYISLVAFGIGKINRKYASFRNWDDKVWVNLAIPAFVKVEEKPAIESEENE